MHFSLSSVATASLRVWWTRQTRRPNHGEFAQALLRVGIGVVLLAGYYPWIDWGEHTWVRYLGWGFLGVALCLLVWVYRQQKSSDFVRFVTLAVDLGTPTILLGLTGELGAIVVFVYSWVAVGHGFRFGLRYLYIAWTVSLIAFVAVYIISAEVNGFWYQHRLLWLGAFVWIAAPTVYVAMLLKQKLVADQAVREAQVQTERAKAEAERERVERARLQAERARAEAEAASEAKSDFLTTMSHEMRTPLNGVIGAAEMLARRTLPAQERLLIDWLLASSRQLRSLIDNLLDLRKIETGKILIESAPLDLHVLMNRLVALFEPDATRKHLRFLKSVSLDAPFLLLGDEARIQQVLINLIANALKFTNEGFVRVSVAALEETPRQTKLRFEIRDTGIGIAPEHAERIFERFSQAHSGIHHNYGGSGLGTTICKHLVELMGGEIGFDSKPGKGALFWFTVPLLRQSWEAVEAARRPSMRGARLIVVSQSRLTHHLAAGAASAQEMHCTAVNTIDEALVSIPDDARPGWYSVLIDAEPGGIDWREAPNELGAAGTQLQCILLLRDVPEQEAFDAGYACVLRNQDPIRLLRALRTVTAGGSLPRALTEVSHAQPVTLGGLRILLAEDNPTSQQIITMMLESGGHRVTVAGDGDSALDKYDQDSFDLIILDMHMPIRNGLDVAQVIRVRELNAGRERAPIIMLTAAASIDLRDRSKDAGVEVFLTKPIDPDSLLRAVDRARRSGTASSGAFSPSTPVPAAASGYLDHVRLREMARLSPDPAFLPALSDRFSRSAAELVDEIAAALLNKQYGKYRELVHALKGSSMMAGAIRLQDAAARSERIPDRDLCSVDVIDELRTTFDATRKEFHQLCAS